MRVGEEKIDRLGWKLNAKGEKWDTAPFLKAHSAKWTNCFASEKLLKLIREPFSIWEAYRA